jgi:DNA-binding response OmpR family regulator
LIVEDTSDLRENLKELLAMEGFAVTCAVNGKEALKKLKNESPDLIITDLIMPGMDGFELIKYIRKNLKWNVIPILVFSAMPPVETEKKVIALGANSYLKKPSTLEIFVDAVNKLI